MYARFRESGRMMPEGLIYISSWIDDKVERCFQLMEAPDRDLLDDWISNWTDLVDFEVFPLITSHEAGETLSRRP